MGCPKIKFCKDCNKKLANPYFSTRCRKCSYKKGKFSKAWKGEKASYYAKHMWIRANYGLPTTCEICKKTGITGRKIHWANINKLYRRKREDWKRLCAKCHKNLDVGNIII